MTVKKFADYYEDSEEETFFVEEEGNKTIILIHRNLSFHTDGGYVRVNGKKIIEGWFETIEYAKNLGVFDVPACMWKTYDGEEDNNAYDDAYDALWDEYNK